MKKLDELQRMKFLEIITIVVSLVGIILTLLHGNLYDYVFDLFSIKGIITFRLLYISLFVYSTLAVVVFLSLFLFNEKNKEIRFYNYIQGWLFIIIAAASYEWFCNLIIFGSQIALSKQIVEDPYTFIAKRASVILFGALFVFWLLEKRKNQIKA